MNTPKRIMLGMLICGVILFLKMVFTPVPHATANNTYDVYDKITRVLEGPSYDIAFKLEKKQGRPYINRGIERGLDLDELRSKLEGKEVLIKFVDHWTPLDPQKKYPTVAYIKLEGSGEVIYDNINY